MIQLDDWQQYRLAQAWWPVLLELYAKVGLVPYVT